MKFVIDFRTQKSEKRVECRNDIYHRTKETVDMNTRKTFTAVFSAAAVFISAAVIVRLPAAEPGQADRLPSVAGPDALRRELWLVQAEALPAGEMGS